MPETELNKLIAGIPANEWKAIKQALRKDRCKQNVRRRNELSFWFAGKMQIEYWKAIERRDVKWFENHCRCFFVNYEFECVCCQMKRLFKKHEKMVKK